MPELPEVETIKNDLRKAVLGKKIAKVEIKDRQAVKGDSAGFAAALKGNFFRDITRIGKLMVFSLKGGDYLLIHLKMTGQLIYCAKHKRLAGGHEYTSPTRDLPNKPPHHGSAQRAFWHGGKYNRANFFFKDKSALYFNDLRRFGFLKIVSKKELDEIRSGFGVDPLSEKLNFKKLKEIIKNKSSNIKSVLMDQSLIAGIGNIYADEILFKAGICPTRKVGSLGDGEIEKTALAVRAVLKAAIKFRGTTFSDYMDGRGEKGNFSARLNVYGREGKKCRRCGGVVKKIKLAGRGTRYCPKCQK